MEFQRKTVRARAVLFDRTNLSEVISIIKSRSFEEITINSESVHVKQYGGKHVHLGHGHWIVAADGLPLMSMTESEFKKEWEEVPEKIDIICKGCGVAVFGKHKCEGAFSSFAKPGGDGV